MRLIDKIIAPSNVLVGVTDNVPVLVALIPVAPVAEIAAVVTPPKVIVNVPAVYPDTVYVT